jgi:ubiquinone/menaquinone biosynthesis C-methylase UbiE
MEEGESRSEWMKIFEDSKSDLDYYQRHGAPTFVNEYYEHQLKRHFKKLLKDLDIGKGKSVLEVGTGTGRWAEWLASMGCTYFGLDFNFHAVSRCQQKGLQNCHLVTMDGRRIGFKDHSFDYVFSITAIQHIPSTGWQNAVREIVRVAKPNGTIVIIEDNSIPWKKEFSKYSWKVRSRRGERYAFIRESFAYLARKLSSGQGGSSDYGKVYLLIDRFLTYISYPLEYLFELVVPARFARHIVLIFRKNTACKP